MESTQDRLGYHVAIDRNRVSARFGLLMANPEIDVQRLILDFLGPVGVAQNASNKPDSRLPSKPGL
jgi:hypothetical protein